MYVDDVVTFIKPGILDILGCAAVVEDFGKVSRQLNSIPWWTMQ
jgi:hypothetical protein